MSLRALAEADNAIILEDALNGFGVEIKLTAPPPSPLPEDYAPEVYTLTGQYIRRGVDIDPETGLTVAGNFSAVTIRLSSMAPALPTEGWAVETTDITGATVKGKAKHCLLDRTAGRATLIFGR